MTPPRPVTVEYHKLPLVEGKMMWIREVRDNQTYRLYVRSELVHQNHTVNPFTKEPEV